MGIRLSLCAVDALVLKPKSSGVTSTLVHPKSLFRISWLRSPVLKRVLDSLLRLNGRSFVLYLIAPSSS